MSYFRIREFRDPLGRKVLVYSDPSNPKLAFMPFRPQRKTKPDARGAKKPPAKVFVFPECPAIARQ